MRLRHGRGTPSFLDGLRRTGNSGGATLLRGFWSEVTFLGADVVSGVEGLQVDGSERAVLFEVGGPVDKLVLAAELFFDVAEADGYVLDFDWIEGLAAGGVGDLLEDFVAFVFAGADVGADGVDDGVGALAHFDGVGLFGAAVVVVAVGDEDEGAAYGSLLVEGEHLVAAGFVERVEEGGASAGAEFADALIEKIDVIGEALGDVGFDVEAFDEGAVVEVENLEEELDGGVLLELETLTDGAGGVEHDADAEGKIGLLAEAEDSFGGTAVVEEAEVFATQAGDEAAFLIGDGEDEIDFVDLNDDGGRGFFLVGGLRLRRSGAGCGGLGFGGLISCGSRCRWGRGLRVERSGEGEQENGGLQPGRAGESAKYSHFKHSIELRECPSLLLRGTYRVRQGGGIGCPLACGSGGG
jgi:hypothetical protein